MPEPFDRRNFRFNGRWPGQAITFKGYFIFILHT